MWREGQEFVYLSPMLSMWVVYSRSPSVWCGYRRECKEKEDQRENNLMGAWRAGDGLCDLMMGGIWWKSLRPMKGMPPNGLWQHSTADLFVAASSSHIMAEVVLMRYAQWDPMLILEWMFALFYEKMKCLYRKVIFLKISTFVNGNFK